MPNDQSEMESKDTAKHFKLTCDHVSKEPGRIVSRDPLQKGEQAAEVVHNVFWRRSDLRYPLSSGWLILDVSVSTGDRKDRLSPCDPVGTGLVAVMQLDTEDFGQAMADLSSCGSHRAVRSRKMEKKQGRAY